MPSKRERERECGFGLLVVPFGLIFNPFRILEALEGHVYCFLFTLVVQAPRIIQVLHLKRKSISSTLSTLANYLFQCFSIEIPLL